MRPATFSAIFAQNTDESEKPVETLVRRSSSDLVFQSISFGVLKSKEDSLLVIQPWHIRFSPFWLQRKLFGRCNFVT